MYRQNPLHDAHPNNCKMFIHNNLEVIGAILILNYYNFYNIVVYTKTKYFLIFLQKNSSFFIYKIVTMPTLL